MTGRIQGIATRFERETPNGIIRVWCGLHQLDLVMQRVFVAALDEEFLNSLTALIGYLRRQQNLVSDMRSTCPKVADTRWLSMGAVTKWFKLHRVDIQQYLSQKLPACTPSNTWWIFMLVIEAVAAQATLTFKALQGLTTLLSQQHHRLQDLSRQYCQMVNVQGPLSANDISVLPPNEYIVNGKFAVSKKDSKNFIDELGVWVNRTINTLNPEDLHRLTNSVALLFTQLVQEISEIVAERNSSNDAGEALPSVLPIRLSQLTMREFSGTFIAYSQRFRNEHDENDEEIVSEQFVQFRSAFRNEPVLRTAIENCDVSKTSFEEGWAVVNGRFPLLMEFSGGLATAFPNTATVESDFSILGYEKNANGSGLTDFSLEGILHGKQYDDLYKISVSKA